jgi:ParB/RepB/Spo0J family partition protein
MPPITMIDRTIITAGNNDRTVFEPTALRELADSIAQNGLIQPITVRPIADGELFQIVAGERRFRAIALLEWDEVPCIVKDMTDEEASAIMLAENVSRADIDPIDEAMAYRSRMALFGWPVAECARQAGVSAIRVQFRLKLLKLRPDVQALVRSGNMPLGYASILSDADLDADRQMIAFARLRDNPSPTPGWFRRLVGELQAQQNQIGLFAAPGPLFGEYIPAKEEALTVLPPSPETHQPPVGGKTIRDIVAGQIRFWQEAAEAWSNLGKPFKRQECEAAAHALTAVLSAI